MRSQSLKSVSLIVEKEGKKRVLKIYKKKIPDQEISCQRVAHQAGIAPEVIKIDDFIMDCEYEWERSLSAAYSNPLEAAFDSADEPVIIKIVTSLYQKLLELGISFGDISPDTITDDIMLKKEYSSMSLLEVLSNGSNRITDFFCLINFETATNQEYTTEAAEKLYLNLFLFFRSFDLPENTVREMISTALQINPNCAISWSDLQNSDDDSDIGGML